MLKAVGEQPDGTPVLLLGIDKENVLQLTDGEPIVARGDEFEKYGGPQVAVIIVYGDTISEILDEFRAHGVTMDVQE